MKPIEEFFSELDRRWPLTGKTPLRVIGSAALMLRFEYERVTKDGDILETQAITTEVKKQLLDLAGPDTELAKRRRMYIDVVGHAIPLLPQTPIFHPVREIGGMPHFELQALDVVDVVVSKLIRFNANDAADVQAMVKLGKVPHAPLVERFSLAVDRFSIDARAADSPRCLRNLNQVE